MDQQASPRQDWHRVVVVGGGFGGLACARALHGAHVDVKLLDRRNHHLFQPLLYQVATGELSPANIASPLRSILRNQTNCQTLLAEVVDFDPANQEIVLTKGRLSYDSLVVATGASHSYFGNENWAATAPGLKTLDDATAIRHRILYAFEAAERTDDPAQREAWLTFVIVGAGPTGVELAGAISEIANHTFRRDFRSIHPSQAKILLVEASDKPLAVFPDELVHKARQNLERLHVQVLTNHRVVDITSRQVTIESDGERQVVAARTTIWAAGVAASPLGKKLSRVCQAETDRAGRVVVEPDFTVPGFPNIYVIGDLACYRHLGDRPLPGIAPVAIQAGRYVARKIQAQAEDRSFKEVFRYRDYGSMAVIGRYAAIAVISGWKLSGMLAWLAWLLIHLVQITQFRNRVLVFIQWGWNFFTRDRAARLITREVVSSIEETSEVPPASTSIGAEPPGGG